MGQSIRKSWDSREEGRKAGDAPFEADRFLGREKKLIYLSKRGELEAGATADRQQARRSWRAGGLPGNLHISLKFKNLILALLAASLGWPLEKEGECKARPAGD